jgi:hypothetical protein
MHPARAPLSVSAVAARAPSAAAATRASLLRAPLRALSRPARTSFRNTNTNTTPRAEMSSGQSAHDAAREAQAKAAEAAEKIREASVPVRGARVRRRGAARRLALRVFSPTKKDGD